MNKKATIYSGLLILLACLIAGSVLYTNALTDDKRKLRHINLHHIQLFMTRDAVEAMYGPGPNESFGCFGCEMDFIYPDLHLSGRYSETLGQKDQQPSGKDAQIKQLTTNEPGAELFGVRVGDPSEQAISILEAADFQLQTNPNEHYYNFYKKGQIYIRLWADDELNHLHKDRDQLGAGQQPVKSITIAYRVKKDEDILY